MRYLTAVLFALGAMAASGAEITLTADDGFMLKADFFVGERGQPAVLLLHQCNGDRSMYRDLGKRLAKHGIHVLALDFRGYGDSVTADVNVSALRASTGDRAAYLEAMAPIRAHWASDVAVAMAFLQERAGRRPLYGAGGASCGGAQAVVLAEQMKLSALLLFSSGLSEDMSRRYLALAPLPTLFVAAADDQNAYQSAQTLFAESPHPANRLVLYKGNAHGNPLFEQDPGLVDTLVNWFRIQLNGDY